ncbi:MAG TPA: hypothetical protein VK034_17510 [Enhygromyxa sp.]|nr:hypothetical protein [Enhygromyxa sp.]
MRTCLAWLASLALLGCGKARELDPDERRPYGPSGADVVQTVQLRNACPEAVVIAVGPTLPESTTPTMTVRSTRTESITVEQGARIWLRYDGEYDEELSVVPSGPVEIGYQCNAIYSQHGGL